MKSRSIIGFALMIAFAAAMTAALFLLARERERPPAERSSQACKADPAGTCQRCNQSETRGGETSRGMVPQAQTSTLTCSVSGVVLDSSEAPAAGIGVVAESSGFTMAARTGADGSFAFDAPAGMCRVRTVSGFAIEDEAETWLEPGGVRSLLLRLKHESDVRLAVSAGAATVFPASAFAEASGGAAVFKASIGPAGDVVFRGLERGEYALTVVAPGFVAGPDSRRVFRLDSAASPAGYRMHRAARISGKVTGPDGSGIPGASVTARGSRGFAYKSSSGPDGEYVLEVLPGKSVVTVHHPDFAPALLGAVDVTEGAWAVANAALERGFTAEGGVLIEGVGPAAGATVSAQWIGPRSDVGHVYDPVRTDENGAFMLDRLCAGEHALCVNLPGHVESVTRFLAGPGPAPVISVRIAGGLTLYGRAVSDAGGPVAGAVITALAGHAGEVRTTSAGDGSFELRGLAPGPVALSAQAEGFAPARLECDLARDNRVRVLLPRLFGIRGAVTFNGAGQTGVRVIAADATAGLSFSALSSRHGRFELTGLPAGQYSIRARAEGFSSDPRAVTVGASDEAADMEIEIRPE